MIKNLMLLMAVSLWFGTVMAGELAGVWMPTVIGPNGERNQVWPTELPMKPETLEQLKTYQANYNAVEDDAGRSCLPYGMPQQMLLAAQYPLEIIETKERITILFELHNEVRRIYLDETRHPDGLVPAWMGHSIGHWQDKALQVETVAAHSGGMPRPHGPRMTVSETYRGIDGGERGPMLELEMTIVDPDFYTTPIVLHHYFRRYEGLEVGEYFCSEDLWRLNYDNIGTDIPWRR